MNGWEWADAQARAAGYDLDQDLDQAQVEAELREYLIQRGRKIAQGHDLGQVSDQRLEELGRLDCMALYPDLAPGLACELELIAHVREQATPYWLGVYRQRQAQGLNPYLAGARGRNLGQAQAPIPATPTPAQDQAQAKAQGMVQDGARGGYPGTPDGPDKPDSARQDPAQDDRARRGRRRNRGRNVTIGDFLRESRDRIDFEE